MVIYKVEKAKSRNTWRIHKYYRFMWVDWPIGLVKEAGSCFTAFYGTHNAADRAVKELKKFDAYEHIKDKWVEC